MTMPASDSAACCTIEPANVTGAVAPASGMEISSAGTPARASRIRFSAANSDQFKGGDGQTANTAPGLARTASGPPASADSSSSMIPKVDTPNAPVTTGLSEYQSTNRKRYQSPISLGTSLQTMAVDCAAYCGSLSVTCTMRIRSAA